MDKWVRPPKTAQLIPYTEAHALVADWYQVWCRPTFLWRWIHSRALMELEHAIALRLADKNHAFEVMRKTGSESCSTQTVLIVGPL